MTSLPPSADRATLARRRRSRLRAPPKSTRSRLGRVTARRSRASSRQRPRNRASFPVSSRPGGRSGVDRLCTNQRQFSGPYCLYPDCPRARPLRPPILKATAPRSCSRRDETTHIIGVGQVRYAGGGFAAPISFAKRVALPRSGKYRRAKRAVLKASFILGGPRVRNLFPPAASLLRTDFLEGRRVQRGACARCAVEVPSEQ